MANTNTNTPQVVLDGNILTVTYINNNQTQFTNKDTGETFIGYSRSMFGHNKTAIEAKRIADKKAKAVEAKRIADERAREKAVEAKRIADEKEQALKIFNENIETFRYDEYLRAVKDSQTYSRDIFNQLYIGNNYNYARRTANQYRQEFMNIRQHECESYIQSYSSTL